MSYLKPCLLFLLILSDTGSAFGLLTFEKVANMLYIETPISTQSPVTLSMCIKNCLEDENCRSVTFMVPSLACSQFNNTATEGKLTARPNTHYLEKVNFPRIDGVVADACSRRLWALERFPQKAVLYDQPSTSATNTLVKVIDGVPFRTRCSGLCLQEIDFICQASQYNFTTKQCTLLANDRRRDLRQFQSVSQGVDYTENLCIPSAQRCANSYTFERYQDVVFPPFYFDKTLPASSPAVCSRLCLNEPEFICRSFLYQATSQDCILSHNDRLATDRAILPTLPRIYAAVLGRPLTEYYEFTCLPESRKCLGFSGLTRYSIFEMDRPFQLNDPMSLQQCEEFCLGNQTSSCAYLTYFSANSTCLVAPTIKPATGNPRGYVGDGDYLQNTCRGTQLLAASGADSLTSDATWSGARTQRQPFPVDFSEKNSGQVTQNSTVSPTPAVPLSRTAVASSRAAVNASSANNSTPAVTSSQTVASVTGVPNATTAVTSSPVTGTVSLQMLTTTPIPMSVLAEKAGNLTRTFIPNESDLRDVSQNLNNGVVSDGSGCRFTKANGRMRSAFVTSTVANVELDACELQCEASNSCLSFSYSSRQRLCLMSTTNLGQAPNMLNAASDNDFFFYEKGTECTNIRFECTDSQIIIKINTDKPFHGRIFVEGNQSPQCSARFKNQKNFSWALPLSAEPCDTIYNGNGEFRNTITLQYHEVLVTKNDRRYQISCKYDVGILNVTSNAFSVMSPALTNITMRTLPPSLSIDITDLLGNPLQSAVLGDTLLLSIVVPENSPYGITAKSCYAFGAKEDERMQLTDETGCPVLPEFFRPFRLNGKTLQAEFDAFRFRNSYVITYQCTINYCLDVCSDQPICENGNSTTHARRKREENFIGAYNLRRQLQVEDTAAGTSETGSSGGIPLSQEVCLANSVSIVLAVFTGIFLLFDVILLVVAIRLHRRKQRHFRENFCTTNN